MILALMQSRGCSSHPATETLCLDAYDIQGGLILRHGDCPGHCGVLSLHHLMPGAPLPPAVTTTNVSGHCPCSPGRISPPFESHWTSRAESRGGRVLCSCSLFLFMAKWKPGASCQPRVCRISGLALQGCLLTKTALPPLGTKESEQM